MKKAFTMIELIFVIVIIGILSSIAISKMAATRDDAIITKGRSQVAAIRNAIALVKSVNMMKGSASYPTKLDTLATATATSGKLFDSDGTNKLLDYPIYAKNTSGHWTKAATNKYNFVYQGNNIQFTYNSADGSFDCDHTKQTCKDLTE